MLPIPRQGIHVLSTILGDYFHLSKGKSVHQEGVHLSLAPHKGPLADCRCNAHPARWSVLVSSATKPREAADADREVEAGERG